MNMKTPSVPFTLLRTAATKFRSIFSAVTTAISSLLNSKYADRPSKMYRLIFSTPKVKRSRLINEQYVIQEPDYYGNYE